MGEFNVRSDLFRAVALAASKEEVRFYLGGVRLEPHPVEGIFLVATDGHRMLVGHDVSGSVSEPVTVRITGDAAKAGKARKTDGPDGRRFLAKNDISVAVEAQGETTEFPCNWLVEGTYPDWKRVLPNPKKLKEATPGFNPEYLGDFAKAQAELLIDKPVIAVRTNGLSDAALVTFGEFTDMFGVLMPVKLDPSRTWMPYFMSPTYAKAA